MIENIVNVCSWTVTVMYVVLPDPATNLVIRFPDGKKEQLTLPCSSKLEVMLMLSLLLVNKNYPQ